MFCRDLLAELFPWGLGCQAIWIPPARLVIVGSKSFDTRLAGANAIPQSSALRAKLPLLRWLFKA